MTVRMNVCRHDEAARGVARAQLRRVQQRQPSLGDEVQSLRQPRVCRSAEGRNGVGGSDEIDSIV